ncbi:MAG: cell division protein FtsA [Candidatus Dependentiae bacterium]
MAKVLKERLMTSIDIGTTKICVLVAQQTSKDNVEVLGMGKAPSEGLQKGVVVNVAKTVQSIKQAIKEAELVSGVSVESAYIGISGAHIRSLNSHGVVPIKKGSVRASDVEHALAAAQAIPVPEGYQVLHVLPQYFIIDGQERLQDPIGMHGIRLEVQAHIILGAIASVQNLVSCCEAAGVQVRDIILEPLASAQSVLSEDERQLGVALLDIGGGTADLAIYQHGTIVHTMVLPIAGNHFTSDIAIGLRTSIKDAERVKVEHGTVNLHEDDKDIHVELAQGGNSTTISKNILGMILHARAQEMLHFVRQEIDDKHLKTYCTSGLVITGGGSLLNGIDTVAKTIFNMPVRIGNLHVSYALPGTLETPIYATGYGLLLHALKMKHSPFNSDVDGPFVKRVATRMKSWVIDFF